MGLWQNKLSMLLFGIGFSLILWGSGADYVIQTWLHAHYNQTFNDLTRALSWLGLGRNQILFTLGIGAALMLRWRFTVASVSKKPQKTRLAALKRCWADAPRCIKVWFYCTPVFLVAGVLSIAIKLVVGRPRPKEVLFNGMPYGDLHPIWQHGHFKASLMSWPSGHTASTFAIGTLLLLAFPRWRWPIIVTMTLLGSSRFLALTPHYLGDVVAGATLGALVALTMAPWLGITAKRK